jgi:hypothetical protein
MTEQDMVVAVAGLQESTESHEPVDLESSSLVLHFFLAAGGCFDLIALTHSAECRNICKRASEDTCVAPLLSRPSKPIH